MGLDIDLYTPKIDINNNEADDIIIEITGLKSISKFIGLEDTPLYYDNGKFFKVENNKIIYTDIEWKDISGDISESPEIVAVISDLVNEVASDVVDEHINLHNLNEGAHPYIQDVISQNYITLDTKIDDTKEELSEDIQQETLARIEVDTTLQNNIDTLTNNLSAETENRINADNLLRDDIDSISGELAQEIVNRQTQDNLLQEQITSNYNTLNNKVDAESSNRISADTTLQNNIDTLTNTVEDNNTTINNRVDEIVDSFDGDISDLTNKVTVNSNDIATIQNIINTYGDIVTYNATDFATKNQGLLADSALQPNDNISELVNNVGYITGITSSDIQTALGYIPYSAENPSGFITVSALSGYATENWVGQQGYLTSSDLSGYATEQWVNNQGFIKGISNTDVINALGYTPYDNSNPAGYITSASLPTVNNSTITIQKNGSDIESFNLNQSTNETINITVPTQTSDLTNNSGFITNAVNNLTNYYLKSETYTKTEVQQLIASIPQFSVVVVQTLPVTGERMILYLVPKEGASPDIYNEYIWIEADEDYELIGNTAIDLTNYVQFTDLATVATTGDYDDLIDKPIPPVGYGTSSSLAATATKVVSIPEITELKVGQVIIVKPSTTSTVANSKIKLNDFEAYNMRYNNANITTSTDSIVWTANVASMFIFDGTYWQFLGHGLDNNTNTTYSSMSVDEGITGTATAQRSLTATHLKQIIQGTKLKGLVTTDDADVVASDSITIGIGKLQAQSTETKSILNDKQDTLVSGTNIKTINNESLLGSGNITIQGGGAVDSVNGQTGTVVLTASDVGALADTTTIPSKTSDLTNDSGFITSITSSDVTTALGYTPYNSSNPNGYITGITSSDVVTALTYTPYNGATNPNGYITSSALSDYVDLASAQDISGRKTFLGEKAIYFKQLATANKLGFTLYNPSNTELGALEYRPNTIGSASLLALNCPQTTGGYVGFRYWGTPAVNIVAPKVATAGNYFMATHITNGNTTVTADNQGTVNISTLLPSIDSSLDKNSTNPVQNKVIAEAIEDISLAKNPNLNLIGGSLNIDSGNVSGFSTTNYMQFPFVFNFNGYTWTLEKGFTTGSDVTTQQNLIDSYYGIAFAIRNGKFVLAISSNGSSWDIANTEGTYSVQANTAYSIKIAWDGSNYTLSYALDETNYTTDITVASALVHHSTQEYVGGEPELFGSGSQHPFTGTINLNKWNLIVNGLEVWLGMDDVGLGSRANVDLSNLTEAGLSMFQAPLVSGTNIKTVNNTSILGSGDISIPIVTVDQTFDGTSTNAQSGVAISGELGNFVQKEDVSVWTPRVKDTNLGNYNMWRALAYDNTKFVALGNDGYISTSTDGITWTSVIQNTELGENYWNDLVYNGVSFIALGLHGYTSTSTDGITWTTAVQNTNLGDNTWESLVYDGTKFVALGRKGYISTSTDGITWTEAVQSVELGEHVWEYLVYDGTKFVALEQNGYISTSTDGITWTTAVKNTNLGSHIWKALAYDGIKFVALSSTGYISTSTDGITWTTAIRDTNLGSAQWMALTYSGTKFVALAQSGFVSTSSGFTHLLNIRNNLYIDFTNNNKFNLLDGTTGLIPDERISNNIARTSQIPDISTKQDTLVSGTNIKTINNESVLGSGNFQLQKIEYEGGDWSLGVNSLNDHSWGSIVQTNDKYVALSATGWISTSTDGTTWTTPVQNTTLGANNWYGLCYNGDKFVTLSSNGSISTSTDGTTWTTPSQISNLGDHSWQALTYGNGKFVGISSAGWVSDSSDGTTWNTSTRDTNLAAYQGVSSITYGNNKFVALGRAGYVWTSTDGTTWSTGTKVFNNISASWLGLDYYNGHFIAINNDGYISTSTDGTTWTTPTQPENLTVSTWNDICGTVIIGWYGYVSKLQENTVLSDISGNLLSVGFSNNTYPVLDGTTGLIPDARLSSNIARTSAIPDISTKQDTLVSGTNIKTINNTSLLGSGNIDIQSGVSMTYNGLQEKLTWS